MLEDAGMNASGGISLALLAFFGTAVPIVAGLYIGTRMADRGADARLCWVVGFAVLLGGWGVFLPLTQHLEKAACTRPGYENCIGQKPNSGGQKSNSGD